MKTQTKLYAALSVLLLPCMAAMPEIDRNKTLGNPTAPVKIEVFSDFTCPHCKHFHEEVLPQLMKDYVVPGKVYIIDRAFVLPHEHSREAFVYATAAARIGKYHAVADALYAQQATWFASGQSPNRLFRSFEPSCKKTRIGFGSVFRINAG